MYLCDCHCDTLMHFFPHPELSLYENRLHLDIRRQLRLGGGLQVYAIYIPTKEVRRHNSLHYTLHVMDIYHRELARARQTGLDIAEIYTPEDVRTARKHQSAALLSIEDGSAFEGSLEILRMCYRLGVRMTTLTWNHQNELGAGIAEEDSKGGLTRFGRQAVREMNRLGMAADVSHAAPQTFWDVLEVSEKPVIATHSNAKSCCSHPRNLTDEQIKALAAAGGIMGITFARRFLEEDGIGAGLDSVCRHIGHVLDLLGSDEYLAIGSDFDGTDLPDDMAGIEDTARLADRLCREYSQETAEKIFHKNAMRFLASVL